MAKTKKFDGHAEREFKALATCPDGELEDRFIKLMGIIGGKVGVKMHINRQHGSVAKKVRKRLAAHQLI